ncbi:hypothetical protein AcW2_000464 [Taiwanofungus camphoratus]|nr:hypothetical protein AcW2_000464 [Antrodia cinnamomea]
MADRQRRLSTPDTPPSNQRLKEAIVVDDEELLEVVLSKIRAQEESEALARRLQDEWNESTGVRDVYDDSNPETVDELDDEALARHLALEWEALDGDHTISERQPVLGIPGSSGTRGKPPSGTASHIPTDRLRQYQDLFIGTRQCKCGSTLDSPRGHVTYYSTGIPPLSLLILLHAPCHSCRTNHCRGCLVPVSCPLTCKGKKNGGYCPVQSCCTEIRAIALFEALGGLDRQYIGERAISDARAREAAAEHGQFLVGTVGSGGTGYSMGTVYDRFPGRGRGGERVKSRVPPSSRASRLDELAAHGDQITVRALMTITHFLPAPYSDSPQIYDMLPHASIADLLSLSQLPDLLGCLLRNDSVTDWIGRINVYHAMLALLRRMADCELTIEVLIGRRWEMAKSCGLEEWMWGDGDIVWEQSMTDHDREGRFVRAPPLYAHFKKLIRQCETFLAGASHMFEDDNDEVAEITLTATSLCGDMIAARDDVERAITVLGSDTSAVLIQPVVTDQLHAKDRKGKGVDTALALGKTYAQECERLAFAHVALSQPSPSGNGLVYPGFNYAGELARTTSADRNPKGGLHLIKELAVMATSLPPGIWVRVDEVRNDAIKVMIAGPEGTPYAGGLFEFDCFIPLEYPNIPPLIHLRTTGGGTVRFNPNLYSNGGLYLSLLGTWPGRAEEQWSSKSTLLQVFVSIHSMILVDLPFFNEPGFGQANPKDARSLAYNRNIFMRTVRWAIVEWLKDEHSDGIWADVIVSHFTICNPRIQKW